MSATSSLRHRITGVLGLALAVALIACPIPASNLQPWPGYPDLQTNSVTRPWLILKCTFSDDRTSRTLPTDLNSAITDLDTFIDLFLTIGGVGTGNVYDYYRDVSYGLMSFNFTRIYGWVPAPFATTNTLSRATRVNQCANNIPSGDLAALNLNSMWGIIMVTNRTSDGGACYDGQAPMQIQGQTYNLACVVFDSNSMYTGFAAHEIGHGLGMPHSWDNTPCQYCDQFDVMSNLDAWQFFWKNYPPEGAETGHTNGLFSGGGGPGLNVPNMLFLGVIPSDRSTTYDIGAPSQTIILTALSHPSGSNPLAVLIRPPNSLSPFYTVEYRQNDVWDQGMPISTVLIHEYRIGSTPYSYLQEGPTIPNGGNSGGWGPGTTWSNKALGVSVTVQRIDTAAGTATVAIKSL